MSIFYLEVEGGTIYAMNATTSIKRQSQGVLSNSLVEDGNYSADNYVIKPVTLTFSGIITDISTFSGTNFDIDPEQYLDGLKRIQVNKTPIKVIYSDIQAPDSNCYFTSFTHTQTGVNGRSSGGANSFKVDFTLQQTRFARGATLTSKPSGVLSSQLAAKAEKNSTTKGLNPSVNDTAVAGAKDVARGKALVAQSLTFE